MTGVIACWPTLSAIAWARSASAWAWSRMAFRPEDAVNLADAPASAVARKNALAVEVRRDVLHAHSAGCAIPFKGKPVDQPHRLGV
jgi:hypothetical protein